MFYCYVITHLIVFCQEEEKSAPAITTKHLERTDQSALNDTIQFHFTQVTWKLPFTKETGKDTAVDNRKHKHVQLWKESSGKLLNVFMYSSRIFKHVEMKLSATGGPSPQLHIFWKMKNGRWAQQLCFCIELQETNLLAEAVLQLHICCFYFSRWHDSLKTASTPS